MLNNNSISVELVYHNGSVDHDATVKAFETALTKHVAEAEIENGNILDAANAILNSNEGKAIPLPEFGSMIAAHMKAVSTNFGPLAERARNYIRANSQGNVTNGVEQYPTSLFVMVKGQGGGVQRRADREATLASKAARQANKSGK